MGFNSDEFAQRRPFLYHVTARENGWAIADTMSLEPASTLLRWAGRPELVRQRRTHAVAIQAGVHRIVLKDQAPLNARCVELAPGWKFEDLVEYLNDRVFFWPGGAAGPVRGGSRQLQCYAATDPLVLRVPTEDLFASNITCIPLFSAFNSGAPRKQWGKPVYRGPDTHVLASEFPRSAAEVVELAFRDEVQLPETTEFLSQDGWRRVGSLAA